MTRVPIKGLAFTTKTLADGRKVKYHYAWRGGPRVEGKYGSPEFHANYQRLVAQKIAPKTDQLQSILDAFLDSEEMLGCAPRTRKDYRIKIALIAKEFGDFPIAGLKDRKARGIFLTWRDEIAKSSKRQADYAWQILGRALSWALDRGLIDANPCKGGGKLYQGSRAERIWSEADEAAFMAVASPQMRLAMQLALWTGQRQGDLLALTWAAYDGKHIRLKQGKTGRFVTIPVAGALKSLLSLDLQKSQGGYVMLNPTDGKKWTEDAFRGVWAKEFKRSGLSALTFHDLRGTAVLRLALAGCTVPEIAVITGHSLATVNQILDKYYFSRDIELANSAMAKLEKAKETK
jgi:integrase